MLDMNMSVVSPPSLLPHFVDTTPQPIADDHLADSCPDDIWAGLINQSYPSLPYRRIDDYTRDGAEMSAQGAMPTVVAASPGGLRATFFPHTGGKLASIVAPGHGELLFRNPVYQPAALARLNAWTSGGVEWNWPRLGHTVFTSAPVFVAAVATDRGPVVRLYEFDREMNTTYQVDVWVPPNGTVVWAHVRLSNPNPRPVAAYWWSNIGVPINPASRVVLEADFAVVSTGGGPRPLEAVPFPYFADAGANATFAGRSGRGGLPDHSYPAAYGIARENFIREAPGKQGVGTHKFMSLHNGSGHGLLHAQSAAACGGRKYWVWGCDTLDAARMNFLSSAGDGDYIEMQAGPAPTQEQTFPMAPASAHEWTESFSPLEVADAASVNGPFADAVKAVKAELEDPQGGRAEAQFKDVDAWMAQVVAQKPPSAVLHRGGAWGALHAALLATAALGDGVAVDAGKRYEFPGAAGLDFGTIEEAVAADPTAAPWASLLVNGTFGAAANGAGVSVVRSFMVDDAWVLLMERALGRGQPDPNDAWLLHLHLGMAAHHRSDYDRALEHYDASATLRQTALAQRNRALALLSKRAGGAAAAAAAAAAAQSDMLGAWSLAASAASATGEAVAGGHEPRVCPPPSAGAPPRPGDAKRDACPTASFARNLAQELGAFLVTASSWEALHTWLSSLPAAADEARVANALRGAMDVDLARAYDAFHSGSSGSALGSPADILRFLAGAKIATTSDLTGGLPGLWVQCQYAVKAAALGHNLTVIEKHHVRLQFPVPQNINFAGAT